MTFFERLEERITAAESVLCVGLDPDLDRLPEHLRQQELPRWAFNRRIIDATHQHAAAYKPNVAFYEDVDGWRALRETIAYIKGKDVPVILDAKRGDIGSTARQYANLLETADAITVNPYMGRDSIDPFLQLSDAGVFVLCRTTNTGASDLQTRELAEGKTVFEHVAELAASWNDNGNVGLVVGATAPSDLADLRDRVPSLPFLVPGVGAQAGDIDAAVTYGLADGVGLVNSSRSIIFAGEGHEFDRAAGEAARQLRTQLNEYREEASRA